MPLAAPSLHEFVLSGPEADGINSLEEGRDRIWLLVAAEYAEVWNATGPRRYGSNPG